MSNKLVHQVVAVLPVERKIQPKAYYDKYERTNGENQMYCACGYSGSNMQKHIAEPERIF